MQFEAALKVVLRLQGSISDQTGSSSRAADNMEGIVSTHAEPKGKLPVWAGKREVSPIHLIADVMRPSVLALMLFTAARLIDSPSAALSATNLPKYPLRW